MTDYDVGHVILWTNSREAATYVLVHSKACVSEQER